MSEEQSVRNQDAEEIEKLKLGKSKYRMFLCIGPNCCLREQGVESWRHLKRRLKELGMLKGDRSVAHGKTPCLNICGDGPVAVVYPGATWYSRMTPERIDEVIERHFKAGEPIEEFAFSPPVDARDPLD